MRGALYDVIDDQVTSLIDKRHASFGSSRTSAFIDADINGECRWNFSMKCEIDDVTAAVSPWMQNSASDAKFLSPTTAARENF